jgi:Putative Flp pilus-assembly TadE/G-like
VPRRDRREGRRRDEHGQATVLIIGLATFLAMTIALVVDATAAYLQRQGLDTLADGAALRGADLGATGRDVYEGGVPEERLELTAAQVRQAVGVYLRGTGAYSRYPGLSYTVRVDPASRSVQVSLSAPLDLPLTVPGSPERTVVRASGAAVVGVDD